MLLGENKETKYVWDIIVYAEPATTTNAYTWNAVLLFILASVFGIQDFKL